MKTVTFCGHGDCTVSDDVKQWLYEAIETEIKNGAELFYLGGYGAFDRVAAQTVRELKQKYPHIKSVLVLAYLNREVDIKYYDDTI